MLVLVRQARRRILQNELLAQGANAGSAALAAFILLLLTGTQILNWQWLVLIPAAALSFGIWRTRRRMPSPYRVAQMLDRRLNLSDTLSTAWFFSQTESRHSSDVLACQAQRAEELARTADVKQVVPYSMPRTAYVMAGLVLIASSLFALRYGLTHTLDLKQPLASMLREQLGWQPKPELAKNERRNPGAKPDAPEDQSADADKNDTNRPEQNPEAGQDGTQDSSEAAENKKDGGQKNGQNQQAQNGSDQGAEQEPQPESAEGQNNQNQQNGSQGNKQSQQQQQGSQQQASSNGESNSLLSKVKDAVQNLLSKVKPPQNQPGQDQKNQQQNGQQSNGKQQSAKNQQQNGEKPGEGQEGQNGDQAKAQQDPQGKGAGKSDSQQASKQPGSGIGSQDGDKSIKQAEQLAAMGKISEILGKRSQNISGEATVEVQATSQQLKTAYVNRGAEHTQGGAEISRDEVPVALQAYVEQYFEQIRKQPQPAPTATKNK